MKTGHLSAQASDVHRRIVSDTNTLNVLKHLPLPLKFPPSQSTIIINEPQIIRVRERWLNELTIKNFLKLFLFNYLSCK